jgi:hypothetical protein
MRLRDETEEFTKGSSLPHLPPRRKRQSDSVFCSNPLIQPADIPAAAAALEPEPLPPAFTECMSVQLSFAQNFSDQEVPRVLT